MAKVGQRAWGVYHKRIGVGCAFRTIPASEWMTRRSATWAARCCRPSSCARHLAFASKPPDGAALGAVDQLCTFRLTDGKGAS
jgi:hypothetical protein